MMVHGVSGLFISAAAGYWVLTQSAGQKGRVKTLGQWLGFLIIVASIAGVACKAYYMTSGGRGLFCPSGKTCPFSGKMVAPAQSG